jgi:hypothetical protein
MEELSSEVMHLRSPQKLSSSNINLNVYQAEMRFATVFSVTKIAKTILNFDPVNEPDRVNDVTIER